MMVGLGNMSIGAGDRGVLKVEQSQIIYYRVYQSEASTRRQNAFDDQRFIALRK